MAHGPPSIRWRVKSDTNEVLRDRFVQKFVPMLQEYGFVVPDPALHRSESTGKWVIGDIDWAALRATQSNVGPDSAARIELSKQSWDNTAWVREALHVA